MITRILDKVQHNFGTIGVTTHTFIFVLVGKELKSWFYTVYIWIFRRAEFPLRQYRLWVPILVSEIICALAQNALIFFISPFVSDAGIGWFDKHSIKVKAKKV